MVTASVIIPTYNYASFICDAIKSVQEQIFPKEQIEIIVVDDGSTDNTRQILQPFVDKGLIKYYFQKNRGKASATKLAIEKASGEYIFNLDADDYFLPEKISKSINIFQSDENIVHVASPALIFKHDKKENTKENVPADILGKPIDGNLLLEYFYRLNILYGGGTTYAAKSSILKKINIPPGVDMYIDEFMILAVLPMGKSYFVREPLSVWRVHGNNYSVGRPATEYDTLKSQRLLKSSAEMLRFLERQNYNSMIVKIYKLKNLTRLITFKERINKKSISDIFTYAYQVFFVLRPGWTQIKNYTVVNRLIPTSLFRALKKISKIHFLYSFLIQMAGDIKRPFYD
jgi:glycosyltransferase involved in cell wall biosynthesis